MSFKEKTREWWKRAAGGKCQYEFYTEEGGWQECQHKAQQVHHIIPEGWQLNEGSEPEHSVGLPLCNYHHTKGEDEIIHDPNFCFHPDISMAYQKYRGYKEEMSTLGAMYGSRVAKQLVSSPFADASAQHRELTSSGERYWASPNEVDQYYIQKMQAVASMYLAQNPDDPKPDTKPHPNHVPKKHWSFNIFGKEKE